MRCPKCGFISFDHIDTCLKCTKVIKETSTEMQGTTFNAASPSFLAAFSSHGGAGGDLTDEVDYPEIDSVSEDYNEELISEEDVGEGLSLEGFDLETASLDTDGSEDEGDDGLDLGGLDDGLTMDLGQFEDESDEVSDFQSDIDLGGELDEVSEPDLDDEAGVEFEALDTDLSGLDEDFGEELENMARDFESIDDEDDDTDFDWDTDASAEETVDFSDIEELPDSFDEETDLVSLGAEDDGFTILDEDDDEDEAEPVSFQLVEDEQETVVDEIQPEPVSNNDEQDDLNFNLDLSDVVSEPMYPGEDISEEKLSDVSLSEIDLSATVGSVEPEVKDEQLNSDPDLDFELDLHGLTLPGTKK